MKKSSLKWELKYNKSEEQREVTDMCLEMLQSDSAKSDAKIRRLKDQVRISNILYQSVPMIYCLESGKPTLVSLLSFSTFLIGLKQ